MQQLESQIRNRPPPAEGPVFRSKALAAMRAATTGDSRPGWLEWGLAAAALFILWGGMLMMGNRPLPASSPATVHPGVVRQWRAILLELRDAKWEGVSILTSLPGQPPERRH